MRGMWVPVLIAAVATSGCTIGPVVEPEATGEEPIVITDAADYSYLNETSNGAKPHVHDYWGDRREITIFEGDVALIGTPDGACYGGQLRRPREPCAEIRLPPDSVVIPATGWLNVSARLRSQDPAPKSLAIHWVSANNSFRGTMSFAGQGADESLETNESMNDPPHTALSAWRFTAWMNGSQGSRTPGTLDAHVSIKIAKKPGPPPLAPGHPDYWGSNRSLVLFDIKGPLRDFFGAPVPGLRQPAPTQVRPQTPPLVPVGTVQLLLSAALNSTTPAALHYDPRLYWSGADKGWGEWEQRQVSPQRSGNTVSWTLAVEPRMWDSPYGQYSYWILLVDWYGTLVPSKAMDGDFHLRLVASR